MLLRRYTSLHTFIFWWLLLVIFFPRAISSVCPPTATLVAGNAAAKWYIAARLPRVSSIISPAREVNKTSIAVNQLCWDMVCYPKVNNPQPAQITRSCITSRNPSFSPSSLETNCFTWMCKDNASGFAYTDSCLVLGNDIACAEKRQTSRILVFKWNRALLNVAYLWDHEY